MAVMGQIELEEQLGRAAELLGLQFAPVGLYPTREPLTLTVFPRTVKPVGTLSACRETASLRTRFVQELTFVGGPGTGDVVDETFWVAVMGQRCGKRGFLEAVRVRVIEQDPVHLCTQPRAGQIFDLTLAAERATRMPSEAIPASIQAA